MEELFRDQPNAEFDLNGYSYYKNWLNTINTVTAKNIITSMDNILKTKLKIQTKIQDLIEKGDKDL